MTVTREELEKLEERTAELEKFRAGHAVYDEKWDTQRLRNDKIDEILEAMKKRIEWAERKIYFFTGIAAGLGGWAGSWFQGLGG